MDMWAGRTIKIFVNEDDNPVHFSMMSQEMMTSLSFVVPSDKCVDEALAIIWAELEPVLRKRFREYLIEGK